MTVPKILVVEDEPAIREMVGHALRRGGFQCEGAGDVAQARAAILADPPNLILLDWMLPGASGHQFARELRESELTRSIPLIMLTARSEEWDKVQGLNAGADDYVTKPFSPNELLARIKAQLRRAATGSAPEVVEIEGLRLDAASHRVSTGENFLHLGPVEFRLLHFLMTHPERVFSRAQLLDAVWGRGVYVEERSVDVQVRRLRKVLAPTGHDRLIQTVRGAGYRFSARA